MNSDIGGHRLATDESDVQSPLFESFLESLRGGGEYVQTSEFTLNSLKAREKLSQYQLSDSGLWIVKLVQAAVSSGAPEIAVRFGKRRVEVVIPKSAHFRAGDILHTVLSGEIPQDPTLRHLVTGLRGCATFSSESVAWRCGGETAVLDAEGSRLERSDDDGNFVLACTRPSRTRAFAKALATSISQLVKETAEEYEALCTRCWPSPIPITIDGKPMPRGHSVVNAGFIHENPWQVLMSYENSNRSSVCAVLAKTGVPAEEGDLTIPFREFASPHTPPEVTKPVYRGSTFLTWPEAATDSKAVIVLESDVRSKDYIDYVLDGAVVQRVPLELKRSGPTVLGIKFGFSQHVCVRFVVPVSQNDLDISQFAVRGRSAKEDVSSIFSAFDSLVDEVLVRISEFWYVPVSSWQAKLTGVGLTLPAAGAIIATKGIALLPMGVLGAWVVGGNTMIFRSGMSKSLRALRFEIQKFIGLM